MDQTIGYVDSFEFSFVVGKFRQFCESKEFLEHCGFKQPYHEGDYLNVAYKYGVSELEHEHEHKLDEDYGNVFFLKNFPNYTSPFWNMKQGDDKKTANKIDVILHGIETIGS